MTDTSHFPWPGVVLAGLVIMLVGCASPVVRPGSTAYRATPFKSTVTITGSDVPGPLRVREADLWMGDGEHTQSVLVGAPVTATFSAWVNGHGLISGRWERDDQVVDRFSLFITYGETLHITLKGPEIFPTDRPGRHAVRLILEHPETELSWPEVGYEVKNPFK